MSQNQKKNAPMQKAAQPNKQASVRAPIILYVKMEGTVAVTRSVGSEILKNLSRGEPPFKPELGLGGCTWILAAGNPYTGITANKSVIIPTKVELADDLELLVFREEDLRTIFNDKKQALEQTALRDYAAFHNLTVNQLNRRQRRNALYRAKAAGEKQMWIEIGRQVSASRQKVGRVELRNSMFSKQGDGTFLLVAVPSMIQIVGGREVIETAIEEGQE